MRVSSSESYLLRFQVASSPGSKDFRGTLGNRWSGAARKRRGVLLSVSPSQECGFLNVPMYLALIPHPLTQARIQTHRQLSFPPA